IRDGDIIEIDAVKGTLDVKLSAEEFAKRKSQWKARENDYGSGYLWKYAQQVGPAVNGAVTHQAARARKSAMRTLDCLLRVALVGAGLMAAMTAFALDGSKTDGSI